MAKPKQFSNIKAIYKKAFPFLCAAGVFLACITCAVLVWYQYLSNVSTTTQRLLLNDAYTTTTAPLQEGVPLTQEFETNTPMYSVGVYFERFSDTVTGTVMVQLVNLDTGEVLLDTTGIIASAHYDSYTTFDLTTPVTTWNEGTRYQLIVTANYLLGENQLSLKKSDTTAYQFYTLTENGTETEGSIALMITYDMLGSTPVTIYFVLCVLFALCAAGLCLLCLFSKGKYTLATPWLAFIVIFVAGLFYQFAMPAFSVPDEQAHYDTAYYLSNTWLGLSPESETANLVKRTTDAQSTYTNYTTTAFTYRYIAENFFATDGGVYTEELKEILGPYFLPYYLPALGLTLGQLLGWGGIVTTFFARCLNLALFAGATALAIKLAPFGKSIFAAVALLPISLHIGGSFSYDCMLLSISFLVLALGLRLAYQEGKIDWIDVATFALLCFLIGPLKSAYFPLTFIALFIPTKRFAKRWQAYLVRFGTPLLSILHFAMYNMRTLFVQLNVSSELEYNINAAAAAASTTAATAEAQAEVAFTVGTYTVSTLLDYPGVLLRLVVNTFFTNFTSYVTSMLGGTLGYQDLAEVNINILLVFAFAVLLMVAMLKQEGERTLPAWQRCTIGGISLMIIGMLVLACFSWTLLTYDTIWGFQGRYLLPVLGFALFAMQPVSLTRKGEHAEGAVLFAGFMLNFLVLLNVASVVFLR